MRGFSPLRDLPALGWLIAVAVVAIFHRDFIAPRWLLFHLLLLGAITHSILVWSQHFTETLLHPKPTPWRARNQMVRLAIFNLAVIVTVVGVERMQSSVITAGAIGVGVAIIWHALSLIHQLHAGGSLTTSRRFAITIRYYIAGAVLLPVGIFFGVMLVRGLASHARGQTVIVHVVTNIFGWVGLTVIGTLITLWPTILRTRIAPNAVQVATRALPLFLTGIALTLAGAGMGWTHLAGAGLVLYAATLAYTLTPHITELRQKAPIHFPGWSMIAGMGWFMAAAATLGVGIAITGEWSTAHTWLGRITPVLAVGFALQVLLGALSYLLPVSIGRGPAGARAANTEFDRGAALRITVVNLGLIFYLLPVPPEVRVGLAGVLIVAFGSFMVLLARAIPAARRAAAAALANKDQPRPRQPAAVSAVVSARQHLGQALSGVAIIALVIVAAIAIDPTGVRSIGTTSAAAGVAPTGEVTTIEVEARDMRFFPDNVTVPAGNQLIITLINTDKGDVHDLVLESGADSGRLAPGESATLDVGVVGRNLDGWCSVLGHRQMGMVFAVNVTGLETAPDGGTDAADPGSEAFPHDAPGEGELHHGSGSTTDMPAEITVGEPDPDFEPYDAVLPPAPKRKVHKLTIRVIEGQYEVAPGIKQELWTFNGTVPGPILRGKIGDRFEITFINDGTLGHSIDFHAGENAPNDVMRTIPPGESLEYVFTAKRAGIWMYHCGTMPMSAHIANGLFGAVIIDPPDLAEVDREYVLLQSEFYLGADNGPVDMAKLNAEQADLVVFNGYADQYIDHPLPAKVDERVRIWVLNPGPNRPTPFHVVGGQFDTVWNEGDYTLRPGPGGSQVLPLLPAQGGFVEMSFVEPGRYPFVSHLMVDAERGAMGIFEVTR